MGRAWLSTEKFRRDYDLTGEQQAFILRAVEFKRADPFASVFEGTFELLKFLDPGTFVAALSDMEQTTTHLDKLKALAALSGEGLHLQQFIDCSRERFLKRAPGLNSSDNGLPPPPSRSPSFALKRGWVRPTESQCSGG